MSNICFNKIPGDWLVLKECRNDTKKNAKYCPKCLKEYPELRAGYESWRKYI